MIVILLSFFLTSSTFADYWSQFLFEYEGSNYTLSPEYQYRFSSDGNHQMNLYRFIYKKPFQKSEFHLGTAFFDHIQKNDEKRLIMGIHKDVSYWQHRLYYELRHFQPLILNRLRYRSQLNLNSLMGIYQETFYEFSNEGFNEFRIGIQFNRSNHDLTFFTAPTLFTLKSQKSKEIIFVGMNYRY